MAFHRLLCAPTPFERQHFGELLRKLYALRKDNRECWVLGGDFNETMFHSEKRDDYKKRECLSNNFFYCCDQIGVSNVRTRGPRFTWSNKRKGKFNVKEKLDHFLVNFPWCESFPNAEALNCGFFGSDHRAVKLSLNLTMWVKKNVPNKNFIFENKWLLENNFEQKARQLHLVKCENNLPKKLERCRILLKEWAKKEVGNSKKRIEALSTEIELLHEYEDNLKINEIIADKEKELEKLLTQEEVYWQQRAKKQWLNAGDRNTTFFYQCTKTRSRNHIDKIVDGRGRTWTMDEDLGRCISSYFVNVFTSAIPQWNDIEGVLQFVEPRVDDAMNAYLNSPFTEEKIKKVVFDINPNKAPGPDGFTSSFFHHLWEYIGRDVYENVKSVLND